MIQNNQSENVSMKSKSTPTSDTYDSILQAYDFFNQALFDSQLPKVIITYHRQRRVMGYTSIARWVNSERECIDELAVNPEYFAKYPLVEICQTLCHEMTHIWQAHYGTPGRRGYHNTQWAKKMISIGLMPSSTSKPGGSTTGESMMDYILEEGAFLYHCRELVSQGYQLPWVDRYPVFRHDVPILAFTASDDAIELDKNFHPKKSHSKQSVAYRSESEMLESPLLDEMKLDETKNLDADTALTVSTLLTSKPPQKSGRVKYCCKSCQILVWGKPGLKLGCLDCNIQLQEVS